MGCCAQCGLSTADPIPETDYVPEIAYALEDAAAILREAGLEPASDKVDNEAAAILLRGDMRLVSGIWLLSQGERYRVQKLQKLPPEALVPPRDAAAMMLESPDEGKVFENPEDRKAPPRVLALSYRWLSKDHPDPRGVQLLKVRGFLRNMVLAVFRSRPDASLRAGLDVGILWDYMSLPQHPRSARESDVFDRGLKAINRVYGSREKTITLQLIGDPDGSHPYHKSGWCRFEEAVSGIGKVGSGLLALDAGEHPKLRSEASGLVEDLACIETTARMRRADPHPGRAVLENLGLGSIADELVYQYSRLCPWQKWIDICSDMSTSRLPPIHPDDMARLLRSDEVAFTNHSDSEMVIQKYQDFFRQVAHTMVRLDYSHRAMPRTTDKKTFYAKVTWSPDQFRLLGSALGEGGLHKCRYLGLGGLNLSEAGARALAEGLRGAASLEEVQLPTEIVYPEYSPDAPWVPPETHIVVHQSVEPAAVSLLSDKLAELSIKVSYATIDCFYSS